MRKSRFPVLLIGLGNPLMGDEGIGWHVAESLRRDQRLPADIEVIDGGTDLLRCAPLLDGRRRVIVVDALLDQGAPGDVVVADNCFDELDSRQHHAHGLSAVQAIELLRLVNARLCSLRFTLVLVGVASAAVRPGLSAALSAAVPRISDMLRSLVASEEGVEDQCASPCLAES